MRNTNEMGMKELLMHVTTEISASMKSAPAPINDEEWDEPHVKELIRRLDEHVAQFKVQIHKKRSEYASLAGKFSGTIKFLLEQDIDEYIKRQLMSMFEQLHHADVPIVEVWLLEKGFKKQALLSNDKEDSFKITVREGRDVLYLRPCYLGGYYWGTHPVDEPYKVISKELHNNRNITKISELRDLYRVIEGKEL